jgi:hypothetical protein
VSPYHHLSSNFRLHEYNEIKDVGQALLGMLAQVRGQGATTKDLYGEFGLELDD